MFLTKLRALCAEADWCAKWGIDLANTAVLYRCAADVVVAGRRSGNLFRRDMADNIDIMINSGAYTATDLIDTFKDII